MTGTYSSGIQKMALVNNIPKNMDSFFLNQQGFVYSKIDRKIARHYFKAFNKKRKDEGLPQLKYQQVSRNLYHKDLQLAHPVNIIDIKENKRYTLPILADMQADGYQDGRPNGQVISNLIYSFSKEGEKARSELDFALNKLKRFKKTNSYRKLSDDAKYFIEYKLNQMSSVYEIAKNPQTRVKRFGQILNHELTHLYRRKHMPNLLFQTDVEEGATVLDSRKTPWYESRDPIHDQYGKWEYQLADYLRKGNRTNVDFLRDGIITSNAIHNLKKQGKIEKDAVLPISMDSVEPRNYEKYFINSKSAADNYAYAMAA